MCNQKRQRICEFVGLSFSKGRQRKSLLTGLSALVLLMAVFTMGAMLYSAGADNNVIYVTAAGGTSTQNGSSWESAYPAGSLDIAITAAHKANPQKEVWVAKGTYNRTTTLYLYKGVSLYGGFAGNETDRTNRNLKTNKTILSRDSSLAENKKFSMVTCNTSATSADTVIDGFTITGGIDADSGGGMYNDHSSPTITNCTFSNNNAGSGGGIFNYHSSPTITNCTFSNNSAYPKTNGGPSYGGGIYNQESSPTVTNCTFSNNRASYGNIGMYSYGGGMYNNSGSSPTVTNCTFSGNSALGSSSYGGGMYNNSGSSPTVTNCTFSGNSAVGTYSFGGGMYNNDSSPTVTSCRFIYNTAQNQGGGMNNHGNSSPVLINCSFSNNESTENSGGGMYNYCGTSNSSTQPVIINCTFNENRDRTGGNDIYCYGQTVIPTVVNSIFASGSLPVYPFSSQPTFTNCLISGSTPSDGTYTNIVKGDPLLISVDKNMDPAAASADIWMYIISGDTSAALGEGLSVGTTVSGDIKVPDKDQAGRSRMADYVDLGAYQYASESTPAHRPVYALSMDNSITVGIGQTKQATLTQKPVNNRLTVAPDTTLNAEITYSGTDKKLSIKEISAVQNQKITVVLKSADATLAFTGFKLTVTSSSTPVSAITLSQSSLALPVGGTKQLTATVAPENATDKSLSWTSSNNNIAQVAADGTITALAAGEVTITAAANDGSGKSASCTVAVRKSAGGTTTTPEVNPSTGDELAATPEGGRGTDSEGRGIAAADDGAAQSYITSPNRQNEITASGSFKDFPEAIAVNANGALALTQETVARAYAYVQQHEGIISADLITTFPMAESKESAPGGAAKLHALSFRVKGELFGAVKNAEEIKVMKVFPSGEGKLFTALTDRTKITDKSTLLFDEAGNVVTGAVTPSESYILTCYVLDEDKFDLAPGIMGTVVDPIAIIKVSGETPTPTPHGGGNGGSCNTGSAAMVLLALLPLAAWKRRK